MVKNLLTLLCVLVAISYLPAQNLWTDVAESGIPAAGERRIQPSKFRSVQLNVQALKPVLSAAPLRFTAAAESGQTVVLNLPLPGGGTGRFQLEETPVMHPDLQAKYPQIRTYTGRGIDDPTAVLKCDLTPWGFHGMVHSGRYGTFFIDPAVHGNDEYYVVYNKKDYLKKESDLLWTCGTPDPEGAKELDQIQPLTPAQFAEFQGDTKLRKYRLALACTGEYAAFHGGTKPLVLAAMNTSMNRVNGVYERDFAVTMEIIANNDAIIYLNGASDPYSNGNGSAMLGQNQTTCNNLIGTANYDIGHVFSTGGGGIAGLNVVCGTSKANGVTGQGSPIGDPFDIDYVAHEMGHQFGGNHTFGNCGGNVNSPNAVEPGSGTTIMAYAGICGAQNVANNSEDIFHGYNMLEMGSFIYTGGANTCPVKITTSNHNPTVEAGVNRTIPKSTPFALTATGSDVDGDTLTYTWEQMDFGNAPSPPVSTATVGPLFRSYKGNTSPTRVFPRLQDLVNNVNSTWEELPGVARTMKFRVTARDNDWYAGCTDEDDMQITVSAASGPFLVTAPNTNLTWTVGSSQTVTWDVANTTAAPVSCANVRITLSTDGGFTYPVELAASVPNNGSANIIVPNNISTTCRVRVESVGNIFFDISNVNFSIISAPTFLMNLSASQVQVCAEQTAEFAINLTAVAGFNTPADISVTGNPSGSILTINPNPVAAGGSATVTITGLTSAMVGDYPLSITATSGVIVRTGNVMLTVLPGLPDAPDAVSPALGETGVNISPTLSWNPASFTSGYVVEVATNPSFDIGSIVFMSVTTDAFVKLTGLQIETVYYWRLRSTNDCGESGYSPVYAFQTGKSVCDQNFSSTDVPKTIPVALVPTPVASNLTIADDKYLVDVNVSVAFTHTYVGDLLAWLVSPAKDSVLLFNQPGDPAVPYGCTGDNGNLTFDAQAAQTAAALEAQCNGTPPALSGTFQSIGSLDAFIGQHVQGNWQFVMGDNYPDEDGGAITSWSLSFCLIEKIDPGNMLVNNPLDAPSGLSSVVFQSHLAMQTSGIPSQGVYMVLSLPVHGTLSLNGTPLAVGGTFTQEDINNGVLTYTNNGDGAATDNFHFDGLDQNNDAWIHDAVFNINVIQNNLAATATETVSVSCNGGSDGQIVVDATGLDGNYSYSLNGGAGQSSNVFDGLIAGNYTVVVTGQFGFTVESNVIIIADPAAISINNVVTTNDLTVNASGGTGVLEYSLNGMGFQSSNEFLDLPNGTYTITVRDENGCTLSSDVEVNLPPLQSNIVLQQAVSCFNGDNGEIVVNVIGGFPPYTYSLNGGTAQSSNTFSNLSAGTYTVVVMDDFGTTVEQTGYVLANPDELTLNAAVVLNAINASASGGTGTLEYSIDGANFQPANQFNNVPNGTYTVTVRDANGCTKTTEATVFVTPLSGTLQATEILCFGGTATLQVNAANGIPPYEYRLGNGAFQSSNIFSGLTAGSYTVTIRDASGTTLLLGPIQIDQPTQLGVTVTVVGNDGNVIISGGVAPYSFLSNAPNPDLQNLPNGTYSVTATDGNGCSATTTFTVNVMPLTVTSLVEHVSCFGGSDGTVTVNAAGGVPPYEYSVGGSPFQTGNVFNNLPAGNYPVVVRDAGGNQLTGSVMVSQPAVLDLSATSAGSTLTATANGGTTPYQYSLNGGTAQSSGVFPNLTPGTYTVLVTDANGCTDVVNNVVVTTGTIEPGAEWGMSVAPNPSAGLFVISLHHAPQALRAEVYDATGRLLQSTEIQSPGGQSVTTLDLQQLPQGTYLLRLTDGKEWGGVRLMKM